MEAERGVPASASVDDSSSAMVQIIDPDGGWGKEVSSTLAKWNFASKGFNYWVVSILGCQSSGKSTLLNLLFHTKFEVMEASLGRSQTTKGVWLGRSVADSMDILVLDVEGTDGREREEQKAFERKSSLFSLALAEVLIINMWHHDVGRHEAANYSLLKTVFELNLQLFGRTQTSSKTLLLFVIRDHIKQVTPLERLKATLETDLNRLWRGITKPDEFAESSVTDFFDINYTSLPNKVLQEETFNEDAGKLRQRFIDPATADYIFKDSYAKDVPADGWSIYAERIWETIRESRDLDLPSQKEMLAMFRCDEIMASAYDNFALSAEPLRKQLNSKKEPFVPNFGETCQTLLTECLGAYDSLASRYHAEVAEKKKGQLREKATEAIYALFILQLSKVREATLEYLETRVGAAFPTAGEGGPQTALAKDFGALREALEKDTLEFFVTHAEASLLPGTEWGYSVEREAVIEILNDRLAKLQHAQLDALLLAAEKKLRAKFLPPVAKLLEAAKSDMWQRIGELYSATEEQFLAKLERRLRGFQLNETQCAERRKDLQKRLLNILKDKLREKTQHILYQMEKRFDEHFRLDENGLPKKWTKADDVAQRFTEAREMAYDVLDLYSVIRLSPSTLHFSFLKETGEPSDIDPELVILGADDCLMTRDRFRKESEAAYVQALREQQDNSVGGRIPAFFWAVMIILGFNEFVALISNPILFILLVIFGVIIYAIYLAGLLDLPLQITQELSNEAVKGAKSWAVKTVVSRVTQSQGAKEKAE